MTTYYNSPTGSLISSPKFNRAFSRCNQIFVLLSFLILSISPALAAEVTIVVQNTASPEERVDGLVVMVYPTDPAKTMAPEKREYKIIQKNKKFNPGVLAIGVGSSVSFPNEDSFAHSVYAFSLAKNFELPLFKNSDPTPPPVVFEKVGKVTLGCNIHDSMIAYIYVTDAPFFDTTKSGVVSLTVPSGNYRLMAWHPRLKSKTQETILESLIVSESAGANIKKELSIVLNPKQGVPVKKDRY